MKKILFIIISLLFLTSMPLTTYADAVKTVDGSTWRWEQETTDAQSLATLDFNPTDDLIIFSGSGYSDRAGMKFGFRCKIAFDTEDTGITIQFPEFTELFDVGNGGNLHYILAFVNTASKWWNTDGNDVKSTGFVIRPIEADKITVELAGRYSMGGAGYGDISDSTKTEYTLDETRTVKFQIKNISENETPSFAAFINNALLGNLTKDLGNGKTMSNYISQFTDNKDYWQFGATRENDASNTITLSYSITEMLGALDAFEEEPITEPIDEGEDGDILVPVSTNDFDINIFYLILYPISLLLLIGAAVSFILYKKTNGRGES